MKEALALLAERAQGLSSGVSRKAKGFAPAYATGERAASSSRVPRRGGRSMWAIDNISNYSASATLHDGTPVRIRAIRPNDKERLARHFDGLGCDSRYHRFFGIKNGLTPRELRYFTEP